MINRLFKLLIFIFVLSGYSLTGQHSIARQWNEVRLESIRKDFARPTVHARNLFHSSILMYDSWAIFDGTAETVFLGKTFGGYNCDFTGIAIPTEAAHILCGSLV